MIEWKKYETLNPPKINKAYLTRDKNGDIAVAEFEFWESSEQHFWIEVRERMLLDGITHYAEINLPDEQ